MYVHATGTIPDLDKLEPYRPEETRVLAELHAEGVVKNLFRLSDRPGVYLIVEADDVEEARRQVGRLPSSATGCSSSSSSRSRSCSEAGRGARTGAANGSER